MEPATATSTSTPPCLAALPPLVVEARRGPQRPLVPPAGAAFTAPPRPSPFLAGELTDSDHSARSPAFGPASLRARRAALDPAAKLEGVCWCVKAAWLGAPSLLRLSS